MLAPENSFLFCTEGLYFFESCVCALLNCCLHACRGISFFAGGFGHLAGGRGILYLLNQRWFMQLIDVDNIRFGLGGKKPDQPSLAALVGPALADFERGLQMIKVT